MILIIGVILLTRFEGFDLATGRVHLCGANRDVPDLEAADIL